MKSVLAALKEQAATAVIKEALGKDFRLDLADSLEGCLRLFRRRRYDFTFVDLDMLSKAAANHGRPDFKEALTLFLSVFPGAAVIVAAKPEMIRETVAAVKAGACDYLLYPLSAQEVRNVIDSQLGLHKIESELEYLREHHRRVDETGVARTNSPVIADILEKIRLVAPTRSTVLLTGETGTGKGLMAEFIHRLSNRSSGPFIAVHCGAIPDTLLESELFGHEKGAFTGALRRRLGKFQIADSGTIFLDEIGTTTPTAQIKLLQVLQDRTFNRVGGEEVIEVDVRVVAATNMDLKKLCQDNKFREDLYYRLNVFAIEMPRLQDRSEDVPLLVETFLQRLSSNVTKNIQGVTDEVMGALVRYPWPGNIRELENVVERAFILESGPVLTPDSIPGEIMAFESKSPPTTGSVPTLEQVRRTALSQVEKRYLRDVLAVNRGRIDRSAAMAGITPRQLHNLLLKYGLDKDEFKNKTKTERPKAPNTDI